MADVLYNFLPGSGNRQWTGHVTFSTVAAEVGVGHNWIGGSKKPAIIILLRRTLVSDRQHFERLILEIVRQGITYRKKRRDSIRPKEIDTLNGLILEVGFKFPDLWDPNLRDSLLSDAGSRARQQIDLALQKEKTRVTSRNQKSVELARLKEELERLHTMPDRPAAGFAFEKLLNDLFEASDLAPRKPFRVVGEQIDGSFVLDHEVYLIEAKWQQATVSESDLLVFRGKIEGKSAFTRGVFVALNGASDQAKQAIPRGKQPVFFAVDGYDLMMVLSEEISLIEFFRLRQRLLAEEGLAFVPYGELRQGTRVKSAAI